MKQETIEKIRQRKAKAKAPRQKKQKKWLFPDAIERQYKRELEAFAKHLKKLIKAYLIPELPSMVYEVEHKMPVKEHADDFLDRLNSIILFIKRSLEPDLKATIAESEQISLEINNFNKRQFQNVTESVFGINLFADEPWLLDQLKLFASQNAQLITGMADQELERVAGIIERGLQEGKPLKDLTIDIQKSFGITERKAKLIARDQTAKLNGSLTRLRQENVGVTQYRWQTSGDERVRNSHAVLDGKMCRWDDPTVYLDEKSGKWKKRSGIGGESLHPRQAINCRCERPIADLSKILDLE